MPPNVLAFSHMNFVSNAAGQLDPLLLSMGKQTLACEAQDAWRSCRALPAVEPLISQSCQAQLCHHGLF